MKIKEIIHIFQRDKVKTTFSSFYFKISLFFLLLFLAPINSAYSADFFDIPLSKSSKGDWSIASNSLSSLDNGAIIEARGEVVLERGEDILKADFARYYVSTGWIFIQGNVLVKLGRDELSASEAEINLNDLTGFLRNGTVLMESQHIYFSGEYVKKHYGDKYSFTNANITTCDPNSPFWQLNANSAVIELDGSAILSKTSLDVAFLSTPNVPYARFSVDRGRKTGFLMPRPGYSSLLGLYGAVPFFWNISDERDINFSASYFQLTGAMGSIIYRSHQDINDKTWLGIDYLYAQNSADNAYWLRGMMDGEIMESHWHYKLNLDYVANSDFLRDYSSSYNGYDNTIDETYSFFGRDFAPISKNRISEGYIYRNWDDALLALGFKYSQDPDYGDIYLKSEDTTVQTPADLSAYLLPVNLLPFVQLDAMGELNYNYRLSGVSGARANLQPRISAPLNLGIISLLPQLSLMQRSYFFTTDDLIDAPFGEETSSDSVNNSLLYAFEIDSLLQASRIWHVNEDKPLIPHIEDIGLSQRVAIQHLFEPSISYTFIPYQDQDFLPYYDQDDRFLEKSEVTVSLRNAVVAKNERIVAMQNNNNLLNNADIDTSFSQLFNLTLKASYNFEEERRTKYLDQYPRRPFRDIELNSQFYPLGMDLSLYSTFSVYGDGITRFDLSTRIPLFILDPYITWSTAYSYRNTMYDYQNILLYSTSDEVSLSDEVALLKNTFSLKPSEKIKINLNIYNDLNDLSSYEINSRFTYYHECFELAFRYNYSPISQSVGFYLSVPGIF